MLPLNYSNHFLHNLLHQHLIHLYKSNLKIYCLITLTIQSNSLLASKFNSFSQKNHDIIGKVGKFFNLLIKFKNGII
jgi:hypothetical protein